MLVLRLVFIWCRSVVREIKRGGSRRGWWKLVKTPNFIHILDSEYAFPLRTPDEMRDKHAPLNFMMVVVAHTHTHTHTHTLSPTVSIKSGMLCLNPPLTGCVEELSRAKHLELSEGPQKQGLAAACRLCLYSQDGIDANGAAPQPTTCIISSNALTTRGCLLSHSLEFYSSIVFVRRCSLQPLEKKLRNSRYWHLFFLQKRKRQGSHPLVIMQRVPLCVATFWKPNHRTKTFIVFDAGLLYCHTLRPIHNIFSSSQI